MHALASRNVQLSLMVAHTDDLTLDQSAVGTGLQGYLVQNRNAWWELQHLISQMGCEG